MIDFSDFKDAKGNTDWAAYRAACIAAGELCMRCETAQYSRGSGSPRLCLDCQSLDTDSDEVTHDDYVRCPRCHHQHRVSDGDNYDLYEDGEHDFTCQSCDLDFEVSTSVSYTFRSPALITADADGDDDDDDDDDEAADAD